MWQIVIGILTMFAGKLITPTSVSLLWSWVSPLLTKWSAASGNKIDDAAVAALDKFFADPTMTAHISDLIGSLISGTTPPAPVDPAAPVVPTPTPATQPGLIGRIVKKIFGLS